MRRKSLISVLEELQSIGDLKCIDNEVDPNIEMASIHLKEFDRKGKAILFQNIKGCKYRACSNIFGSFDRSKKLFNSRIDDIKLLIDLRNQPQILLKEPFKFAKLLLKARLYLPKKVAFPNSFQEINISDLPQIKCWPNDGGAFITLPQVYTEDIDSPGVLNSNLGMYRIQISGNQYVKNKEIGLHYQLHRGIGVHQTKANKKGIPLKVSIFVGGHPAHSLAAVMPLPEGITELGVAGMLAGRRFRYSIKDGYTISSDADFVICGEVYSDNLKPEGPFGDHLGYYSLKHDFPVLNIHKVYAKKDAIWPFTVVGRPPQEDTQFGLLIHDILGKAIEKEIPGLKAVNAVDAAGVHPLLLAIGSERYTPYNPKDKPQEILTIANHILGKGQMSLAKYLFICDEDNAPDVNNELEFFTHFLKIVVWERDMHFHTKTTIDTLDYSGEGLNEGSKVVIAAVGGAKRDLLNVVPKINLPINFSNPLMASDGNLVVEGSGNILELISSLEKQDLKGISLITLVDDSCFTTDSFANWLWVTFTRSNPAYDIYGINSIIENKHFSCSIPIIDSRIKPHHAPVLER